MKKPLSLSIHAGFLALAILMVGFHTLPRIFESRIPHLLLTGAWKACIVPGEMKPSLTPELLGSCNWFEVKGRTVPASMLKKQEWIVYKTEFPEPQFCIGTQCSLVIGTMSDPTEGYLNGALVGKIGRFPPNLGYSQTYPLVFSFPGLKAVSNELLLLSRPVNRFAHGMIRNPVGIFSGDHARTMEEILVGEQVITPLISAMILFLIAAVGLGGLGRQDLDKRALRWFVGYCVVKGFYLINLTRIPREYLPLDIAYDMHFTMRVLSEVFLVGVFGAMISGREKLVRGVWSFYLALVTALVLLIPFGSVLFGDIDARINWNYRLGVMAVDTFALTYLVAFPLALRARKEFSYLLPVFTCLCLMQFWDSLALNGLVEDIYFARVYPVPLALTLGVALWQKGRKARRERDIAAELGQVAGQVAHDLRSPLALLGVVAHSSASSASEESEMIQLAIGRIREVSNALLDKYRASKEDELAAIKRQNAYAVESVIEPVLREFRGLLKHEPESAVTLTFQGTGAQVAVDRAEFKRVLSNLLNNAVEALPERKGKIEVVVSNLKDQVQIDVRDSGVGISKERLNSVFERGSTEGKGDGHGFGLSYARQVVEGWNGRVELESREGEGTVVSIQLPRV